MCAVSMVVSHWPQQYPDYHSPSQLDLETAKTLKEILRQLEKIDTKLGAKDCKDELKADFFKQLDERINKGL